MAWLLNHRGQAFPLHEAVAAQLVLEGNAPFDPSLNWSKFTCIAITIPKFTDGRGYSLARLINERTSFKGELRAQGDILVDQVYLLARVGFTSFALREDQSIEAAQQALTAFDCDYTQTKNDAKELA